ncbi:MAG: M20 metallopeptidase family protein, partial [Sporomusa sp.]
MTNKMRELIIKEHDYVVSMRRYFRMFPEISAQEYETQKKIMAELKAIGLEPRPAAGTGVIAEINGNKPGKTVAIRADIDALPLQDKIEQPYCSRNVGVCHACGHDGHTAILLTIARVFTAIKNDFSGTIRLVFQPSEERFPGGA